MRIWLAILLLLLAACLAAWGWHALALDPGTLLVRFAGWRVETSFVLAVVGLLLLWVAASLLWRLAFWPRAAWRRRAHRRGRERIADGLVALIEGRYAQAGHEFDRAAHVAELSAPAQLAHAQAAHVSGDDAAATSALDAAASAAPSATLSLRARFLLDRNRAADALTLLKPEVEKSTLSPSAWQSLNSAAVQCGDADAALATLAPLARSQSLAPSEFERVQATTLAAALTQAPDIDTLNQRWSSLSRAQRQIEAVVIAYAQRAAALGQPLPGRSEIEAGVRRGWSDALVRCYGELGPVDASGRLRQAEAWFDTQPNNATLLLTLGRLCNDNELWGKAREYLQRALVIAPDAAIWEAFGDACTGQGDETVAARAYHNALRSARGDIVADVPDTLRGPLDTRAIVFEERSEHGVPRLR